MRRFLSNVICFWSLFVNLILYAKEAILSQMLDHNSTNQYLSRTTLAHLQCKRPICMPIRSICPTAGCKSTSDDV